MKWLWLLVLAHKWPTRVSWQTNSCGCAINDFSLIGGSSIHQLTPFCGINVVVDIVQHGHPEQSVAMQPCTQQTVKQCEVIFPMFTYVIIMMLQHLRYSHERLLSIKTICSQPWKYQYDFLVMSQSVFLAYLLLTCDPTSPLCHA